ncbi:MAG: CoA transferase [Chloroflexi bacterium]|nr:CoA transferase [Chloroflexota bacterium]
MTAVRGRLPLEGVRILDLGQFWAAPNAGRAWADAGAEVIKVESCRRPDPLRIQARGIYPDHDPRGEHGDHWNRSGMINERNRNKLGLTLDLQEPRGRDLFLRLARVSDAVSQNFSTGVLERLGLGYNALAEANPRIILVSIMSQGLTGPESSYVSYGGNLEQLGGISHLSGYPDDPDSSVGFALPDPLGGATAALALLAALRHRDRTGRGMEIDLSQREAATLVVGDSVVEHSLTGEQPPRIANHEPGASPSDAYPCAGYDEWVTLVVRSDADWARLCTAIGRSELAADPRFATIVARRRHRDEVDALITAWTAQRSKHAAMSWLQQWGVAAGAVLNPRELFVDPHLRTRGFWERVHDPSDGEQEYYGRAFRFSASPLTTRMPTPQLGQHNREILSGLLGLADAEIDELERDEVIGTRPVLNESGGLMVRAR